MEKKQCPTSGAKVSLHDLKDCKNLREENSHLMEPIWQTALDEIPHNRLLKLDHECYDLLDFLLYVLHERYLQRRPKKQLVMPSGTGKPLSDVQLRKIFDQVKEALHSNVMSELALSFKAIRDFHDPLGVERIFQLAPHLIKENDSESARRLQNLLQSAQTGQRKISKIQETRENIFKNLPPEQRLVYMQAIRNLNDLEKRLLHLLADKKSIGQQAIVRQAITDLLVHPPTKFPASKSMSNRLYEINIAKLYNLARQEALIESDLPDPIELRQKEARFIESLLRNIHSLFPQQS